MYTLFCAGPPAPPGSLTNVSALCRHWREPQRRWLGATVSLNATNGPNPPPPPPPPPPPQNLPGEYVSHRPPRGPSPTTLTSTHPAAPRPCPAREASPGNANLGPVSESAGSRGGGPILALRAPPRSLLFPLMAEGRPTQHHTQAQMCDIAERRSAAPHVSLRAMPLGAICAAAGLLLLGPSWLVKCFCMF